MNLTRLKRILGCLIIASLSQMGANQAAAFGTVTWGDVEHSSDDDWKTAPSWTIGKKRYAHCNTDTDWDYICIKNKKYYEWIDVKLECFPSGGGSEKCEMVVLDSKGKELVRRETNSSNKCSWRIKAPPKNQVYYIAVRLKSGWNGTPVGYICETPHGQVDTWSDVRALADYYYSLYAAYGYYDYAYAFYHYYMGTGNADYNNKHGNPAQGALDYYLALANYYLGFKNYSSYFYYLALGYYYYFAALGDYNSASSYYYAYIIYAY